MSLAENYRFHEVYRVPGKCEGYLIFARRRIDLIVNLVYRQCEHPLSLGSPVFLSLVCLVVTYCGLLWFPTGHGLILFTCGFYLEEPSNITSVW